MSGVGDGVGRGVAVARSASNVGFGVTVATRLGTVGLGASETSVGSGVAVGTGALVAAGTAAVAVVVVGSVGVAVGRVSTTTSSGWMRGVAVGAEDWHANANAAQVIADDTSDLTTTCI